MFLRTPRLDRRSPAAFAAALVLAVLSPSLAAADSPFPGLELVACKERRYTVPPSRRRFHRLQQSYDR